VPRFPSCGGIVARVDDSVFHSAGLAGNDWSISGAGHHVIGSWRGWECWPVDIDRNVGSFFGTLLIGYLMIPFMPNSKTMYLTSAALLLVCAGLLCDFSPAGDHALGDHSYFGGRGRFRHKTRIEIELSGLHRTIFWQLALRADTGVGEERWRRYYLNDFLVQIPTIPSESKVCHSYLSSVRARAGLCDKCQRCPLHRAWRRGRADGFRYPWRASRCR